MNRTKVTSPVRISSVRGPMNIVWGLRHKVVFETTLLAIHSIAGHFLSLESLDITAFRKSGAYRIPVHGIDSLIKGCIEYDENEETANE